jgi:hypothetical protein
MNEWKKPTNNKGPEIIYSVSKAHCEHGHSSVQKPELKEKTPGIWEI